MRQVPPLKIQLTFGNLLVFLFFFLLMHEMHELAHIITGRLICGCWGTRDFNVWDLCSNCLKAKPLAILATFAGPIFTFSMLWLGRHWLIHGKSAQYRSLGLVLILGNMQFGRMYMAATGSGDEAWAFRYLFINHEHSNTLIIRIAAFLIVSAICLPPLVTAYKSIANKRKILIYVCFLVLPLVLDTIIILMLLNGLLAKGVLNQVYIMGSPLLVSMWFVTCLLIVLINGGHITHFFKPEAD